MNIALIGYGKMGKAIETIAPEKNHRVVLKIDINNIEELTSENLQKCDVAIEFTNPDNAVKNILQCFDAGIPVVCGTTGWLISLDEVQQICKQKDGTFLCASNFSVGVNLFFEINKYAASLMNLQKEYDVSIDEIHHTQKKDSPSGTAITLAEQIIKKIDRKNKWINSISDNNQEVEIISKRIDPAPGTHKIKYTSAVDDIEIIHTAHNRQGFAKGAILAAEFLQGKKGIYTMKDVLSF